MKWPRISFEKDMLKQGLVQLQLAACHKLSPGSDLVLTLLIDSIHDAAV